MTAERDGKSGRGQPDLLATLPAERPPASQPAPGIDPAQFEELLTGVRDLREEVAGLRKAAAAEQPAALTSEALEVWGDKFVTRVAEAARTVDAPAEDEAVARLGRIMKTLAELTAETRRQNAELSSIGDELKAARTDDTPGDAAAAARVKRIEDAAAKAAAAAERIDGGLESTADRVAAEIEGAVTRIEKGLATTRDHVDRKSRLVHPGCRRDPHADGRTEVRLADGFRVVGRPRLRHVDREPHPHPLQLAVGPMSRRRSPLCLRRAPARPYPGLSRW